jgi:asparagine synthetase B (glutamine-hydrolysing)
MEEPPIDMAIPSYLISRAARETLTVMLSGMGGDEVFAGYPRQMAMKIASCIRSGTATSATAADEECSWRSAGRSCRENSPRLCATPRSLHAAPRSILKIVISVTEPTSLTT